MTIRRSVTSHSNSQTWIIFLGIGVCLVVVLLIFKSKSATRVTPEEQLRRAAYGELEAAAVRAKRLAAEYDFPEALREIEAVSTAYLDLSADETFAQAVQAAATDLEGKRDAAFRVQYGEIESALAEGNVALCRTLEKSIRRYGSPKHIEQMQKMRVRMDDAEATARTAKKEFRAACARAIAAASQHKFGEAMGFLNKCNGQEKDAALAAELRKTTAEVEKKRREAFEKDWKKLESAIAAKDLVAVLKIKGLISSYGTDAEKEKANDAMQSVIGELSPRGPAEGENREGPNDGGIVEAEGGKKAAGKLSMEGIRDYLERVKDGWRQDLPSNVSEVTGSAAVIPDALRHKVALMALEDLEQNKSAEDTLKKVESFVRSKTGQALASKPIIEITIRCSGDYGVFFMTQDWRKHFLVKYNDALKARTLLEEKGTPRYSKWLVYAKGQGSPSRSEMTLGLLQKADFTLRCQLNERWKNERLAVEVAGLWCLKELPPLRGPSVWGPYGPAPTPGELADAGRWEGFQTRRSPPVVQYLKSKRPDYRIGPAVFVIADLTGKEIPLPAALEGIFKESP